MYLSIITERDDFRLTASAPTVISPDGKFSLQLLIQAHADLTLESLSWQLPSCLDDAGAELSPSLPLALAAGESAELQLVLTPQEMGFGFLTFYLHTGETSTEPACSWQHWVSVFKPAKPSADEPLPDDLRQRLISVVNYDAQNGHIFLANYTRFFNDYLNILVPEERQEQLAEEFALPAEGLPLDDETYLLIAQGKMTFYGVEKLELIAEEDCNASDDRFDPDSTRETAWEAMDD